MSWRKVLGCGSYRNFTGIQFDQLPLINCMVGPCPDKVGYLMACVLISAISQPVSLSGHDDPSRFEWHRQWHWIDSYIDNYVVIASLKSEPMGKLINRMPGSHLLISSLPGSALWRHVKWLCKLHKLTSILKRLPSKLDINRHSPCILYLPWTESRGSTFNP